MKKDFFAVFVTMVFLCLTGCSSQNEELLYGEWEYKKEPVSYEGGWGDIYSYEFTNDGKVKYFECLHLTLSDDGCEKGSSVWIGKFKLNNNIVEMSDFELDKNNSYKPSSRLSGPKDKMIIDFDNMYFCNRSEGLDCNNKYEKAVE